MGKKPAAANRELVSEAARIVCSEALVDYHAAKLQAAERLGLSPRTAKLPDNLSVRDAVIEYQRLYGGRDYRERLTRMRHVAVRAMRMLAEFEPRLVGAVASGAVTPSHHVQLQVLAEAAEVIDIHLHNQSVVCRADDRDYRYADGSTRRVPLTRFTLCDIGVDVATFDPGSRSRPPLSPVDGHPERGLDIAAVEALIARDATAATA